MTQSTPRSARYGVAIAAAVAVLVPLTIPIIGQGLVGVIFFAVMLSAWYGGRGPGLVTTGLILAMAVTSVILRRMPFPPSRIVAFAMFGALGVTISLIIESLHRARRLAERNEKWLSAVLTSIGDAVIATDRGGEVVFMNPVAQSLTGWESDEASGRPLDVVFQISSEVTRLPTENPVQRVLREGAVVGLGNHTILTAKDGVERPIDDSAAPIRDAEDAVAGVVLVFRDVTDRRREEEERSQLLAREQSAHAEAEAANEAKDRFLAVLSHELRTPLTPVLLGVTALLEDAQSSAEIRPTLEMARHNLELEARLIDDLLDLTRIVRGKFQLHRTVLDVHALISRVVEICGDDIRSGGLNLTLDLNATSHHIYGDPARIHQVLWNLLKNAVKFSNPGGSLTISTRTEDNDEPDGSAGILTIEVADTGIGIAHDLLPRIFDAFEQGDPRPSIGGAGGLGLGLAISRSIIDAHEGELTADSDGLNLGARFTVKLAAAPTPKPSQRESPSPSADAEVRRLNLLVVEDDETTLRVLTRLLRNRGHDVTAVATVAAALESVENTTFDLIVSDLRLPDGSGLDLMRQIRSRSAVKGIALSGFGMDDDVKESREAGFIEHLIKPVDIVRLEESILRVAMMRPV
jgi:PAS domain S-box-containing protein